MGNRNKSLESNAEWEAWGQHDPLWGVLSWAGRRREDTSSWTDPAFYALGKSDWADFRTHWERYGCNLTRVVEIGSGVGRITAAIAEDAETIYAVDVSPAMLNYAKTHVESSQVTWLQGNGRELPIGDGAVTAVFSCHVLQHLPTVQDGLSTLSEGVRALAPGGTLMIHLPMHLVPHGRSGHLTRRLIDVWATFARMKAAWYRTRLRHGGNLSCTC